ncbi:hypothetical protein ACIHEJ_40215 [Streptomyces sp. NPDC052301]|uniref:hypothetical protein n=1 Tax=Streptomyces sp. NPDC052301 TaxID=3365687 RepID=UPI0037D10F62
MSKLAQRYWASLSDTDVPSLDQMIERGRSREGALWRRYLASLLDVPMTQAAALDRRQTNGDASASDAAPASTAFHALDTAFDVGAAAEQPPRRWWGGTSMAFAALLIIVMAFGAARLLSPAPRSAPPSTPVTADYHTVRDPAGFTVVVPRGWPRKQVQGELTPVVYYDSPEDGRQLQIFEAAESSPMESLSLAEKDPDYGYTSQPGYKALHRASGTDWAELTYRYNDKDKGALQVNDHRFRAADGNVYAIRTSSSTSLPLILIREPLDIAVRSFCPSSAVCTTQTFPTGTP